MGKREGSLTRRPFVLLLGDLHWAGVSGALRLHWGMGRRTVYFDQGRPVLVTGAPMMDTLGTLLLNERRIGPSVRAEALRLARAKNLRLGEALIALHALSHRDLEGCLARQLENRLLEPFAWTGGDFVFTPGVRPPAMVALTITVEALIDRGVALGLTHDPMAAWSRAAATLSLTSGPRGGQPSPAAERPPGAVALAKRGITVGDFLERCGLERPQALELLTELLAHQRVVLARPSSAPALPPPILATPVQQSISDEDPRRRDGENLLRFGRVCLVRAKAGRRGFAEAAEVYLLRAVELQPDNADALRLLSELEQCRANHALARRYQDKARRLEPSPDAERSTARRRTQWKLAIGAFALAGAALLAAPRLFAKSDVPPRPAARAVAPPAPSSALPETADPVPGESDERIRPVHHRSAISGQPH